MDKKGLAVFRESLNCLGYSGTTVKAFAEKINMNPQTICNYRNGRMPSPRAFRYIMYMLQIKCPEALKKGIEIYKASQEEDSILNNIFDDKGNDNGNK